MAFNISNTGFCSVKGARETNQDCHFIIDDINVVILGIFDGHGW